MGKSMGYEVVEEIEDKEVELLEPLGDSSRMPKEEREKWERWNREIPRLTAMFPNIVYMNGSQKEKTIGLTFDDGPDKHFTPLILDVLKAYGVKATFFVHGNRAKRYKELVRRMDEEGHYLGCHTCTHPDLTTIGPEAIRNEIEGSCKIIKQITGKVPRIVRPPFGEMNQSVVQVLDNMDKKVMLWSTNTFDWLEKTPDNIIRNVLDNVRSGEVVLMHSYTNKRPTLEALPVMIEALKARGYKFLSVDEMIDEQGYEENDADARGM